MNKVFKNGLAGLPFYMIIMYSKICIHQQIVTISKRKPKTNFKT